MAATHIIEPFLHANNGDWQAIDLYLSLQDGHEASSHNVSLWAPRQPHPDLHRYSIKEIRPYRQIGSARWRLVYRRCRHTNRPLVRTGKVRSWGVDAYPVRPGDFLSLHAPPEPHRKPKRSKSVMYPIWSKTVSACRVKSAIQSHILSDSSSSAHAILIAIGPSPWPHQPRCQKRTPSV